MPGLAFVAVSVDFHNLPNFCDPFAAQEHPSGVSGGFDILTLKQHTQQNVSWNNAGARLGRLSGNSALASRISRFGCCKVGNNPAYNMVSIGKMPG